MTSLHVPSAEAASALEAPHAASIMLRLKLQCAESEGSDSSEVSVPQAADVFLWHTQVTDAACCWKGHERHVVLLAAKTLATDASC